MSGRGRLFDLMARREGAAATRAALATARALNRAEEARLAQGRVAGLLPGLEAQGLLSAADLRQRGRLVAELAREAESLSEAARAAEAEAARTREKVQYHEIRRSLIEDAARTARRHDAEAREARAEAARIPPRQRG